MKYIRWIWADLTLRESFILGGVILALMLGLVACLKLHSIEQMIKQSPLNGFRGSE